MGRNFEESAKLADFQIGSEYVQDASGTWVVRLLHVFNGRDVSEEEYDRLMSDLMAGYEEVSFTPSYLGHWVQDPVDGSWDWSWSARGTVFTDRDLQAFLDSYVSVR